MIHIENRQKNLRLKTQALEKVAGRILSALGCPDAEISVVIVDDEEIRSLNRDYLGRDRATNVISFAMQEGEGAGLNPEVLGDVVISAETADRHAREAELPFESELYFLLLHGTLHLLGFDHERGSAEEARRMEAKEEEVFDLIREEFLPA
ncbi:rRNA maturation RNase YbeY [uncultured Desulfuromonas sp.]|uniref:rRNA maturation RNase YbeY n=1 Tax=uncultured Desulfuromonas sp. TaxID=181013 RepID=UPI002627915B|nr:rRNA maturation RNase YbeY [uncultured Desulfuromonas sp.]